ncbi:MAG: hypothetical protein ACR2LI_10040 [Propionibacteriaceae bacterium]
MDRWSDPEWLTLRLGPLWALSALTGRCRFDADEQRAFWDCVSEVATASSGLSRTLLAAMASDRRWLFDEFELDGRSIVSGFNAVTTLLERAGRETSADVRQMLLRVGREFARARGPFGRRITIEDQQTLLLMEQLLQSSTETADDNPLNSHRAI